MKRVSIYFLAFLTFWMSTWMVTDIHDWSLVDANQLHPVFSVQQSHSNAVSPGRADSLQKAQGNLPIRSA